MKNWIFGLFAIAALVTACQKDERVEPTRKNEPTTLTIAIENDLAVSRTEFGELDGSQIEIVWSANDEVTLYNQAYELVGTATLTAGAGTAEGTFSTEADLTGVTKLYVLHGQDVSMDATNFYYTMPATQAYVNGNIDGTILPQFGSSDGNTLTDITLKNLATVLRFDLKPSASTTISSIAVGKVNEPISGALQVAWANPANKAAAVAAGENYKVEVKCMVGENKTSGAVIAGNTVSSFYMVLPYVADELTGSATGNKLIVQVAYAAVDAASEITKKPLAAPSLSVARSTVHPITLTLTDVPNTLAAAVEAFEALEIADNDNYIKDLIDKMGVEPTKITFVANQADLDGLTELDWDVDDNPLILGEVVNESEVILYTPYSVFALSGNCYKMFAGMGNLEEIDFNNAVNTEHVIMMNNMFQENPMLRTIRFGANFITKSVETMEKMFYACPALEGVLDLSAFELEKVTSMKQMFAAKDDEPNTALTGIQLNPNTTTPVLKKMDNMFAYCAALQTVDMRGITAENVTSAATPFAGCAALRTVDMSDFVGSSIAANYAEMFAGLTNLTSVDLSSWSPASATTLERMFAQCSNPQSVTFGENFDSNKVTTMRQMFYLCSSLLSLDLSHFDSGELLSVNEMLYYCKNLSSLTLGSDFTLQKTTDLNKMFQMCLKLQTIDLTYFDTDAATDMGSMFGKDGDEELEEGEYVALEEIVFGPNFNTSKVTKMPYLFGGCSRVTSLDLEVFDLSSLVVDDSDYLMGGLRNCYIRLTQDAYNVISQTAGFSATRNTFIIAGTQN